jgi:hypothetical protein
MPCGYDRRLMQLLTFFGTAAVEIGRTCSTYWRKRKFMKGIGEKPKGKKRRR